MSATARRITVNLSPRADTAMQTLVSDGISMTDAVNRGLTLLQLVRQLGGESPEGVSLTGKDGQSHQIHLI